MLLVCVFSDEQLAEVAGPLAAALPDGAVLASHVTGRESTLRSVAARFPAIAVVDAPVSGAPDDIRAGRLTVLLGGPADARARAAGVVRAYADPVIETGELGTALAVKLVNNFLFAANTQVLAEAVWLGEQLGVAPGETAERAQPYERGQPGEPPRRGAGRTWPRSPPGSGRL